MDEVIAVLYYHAQRGELARCSYLMKSQLSNQISADTQSFIEAVLQLAQGNAQQFNDHHTASSLAAVRALAELLYVRSRALVDSDRVTILQSYYEIELASLPQGAHCMLYFVCGCFGADAQDYVKFEVGGAVHAAYQFYRGVVDEIKSHAFLCAAAQDELQMRDVDSLFYHLQYTKTGTVKGQILHMFKNKMNVLVALLATCNFASQTELISAVSSTLQQYCEEYIGVPGMKHQIRLLYRVIIAIARAYPNSDLLLFLCDFLGEKYAKVPELVLLHAYLLSYAAYMRYQKDLAQKAVGLFYLYPEAVVDDQGMKMSPESAYSLALAVEGRLEEAKAYVNEDGEADYVVKLLLRCFSEDCGRECLDFCAYNAADGNLQGHGDLYGMLPDSLVAALLAQKVVDFLQRSPLYDTAQLQAAFYYFDAFSQACMVPYMLHAKFLLLSSLQNFDFLLRQANELSNYAATERNFALNSQILLLFAGSAAQLHKTQEAAEFMSYAQIVDAKVQEQLDFKLIQAKIAFLRDDFLGSAKYYDGMEGDLQVRIHVDLLRVRGGNMDGYLDLKNLQADYPVRSGIIEMQFDLQNRDFIAMHVALALATAGLFILRGAGYLASAQAQHVAKNSFEQLIDENSLLFFENYQIVDTFRECVQNSFSSTASGNVGSKYIGAKYGAPPVNLDRDVFYAVCERADQKLQDFARKEKITIQAIVYSISNYSMFSLEITELMSQVHLVLLNDKIGYVSCFSYLIKQTPSTTKLAALASAHLAVGNAQQAQEYYYKAIEESREVIRTTKLPGFIETLITNFLYILKSRALSRCHRYADCNYTLGDLSSSIEFKKNADAPTEQANLIVFALVQMEHMQLLIKLRKNRQLFELCDNILRKAQTIFGLPQDTSKPYAVPFPVTILSIFCCRAKAELIKLGHVNLPTTERLDLLQRATYYVDTGVLSRTQRVLVPQKNFTMQMCQSVFSSQKSRFQGYNDGLKALVLAAEVRVEMAEVFFDLSRVDVFKLRENTTLAFDKRQHLYNAADAAKISIKHCETTRAHCICAIFNIIIANDYEKAREHAVAARTIEPFAQLPYALLGVISHKMNFGADAQENEESDKANTPFEDSCRVLRSGVSADGAAALDSFLLNSCLVHDMTVVTEALFAAEDHKDAQAPKNGYNAASDAEYEYFARDAAQAADQVADQNFGSDAVSLEEMNTQTEAARAAASNGYFHLGRGFLQLKMGRIQPGMHDLLAAVNSQALSDRYRARALFLLGTVYVNPTRQPLYGYASCLTGKQQSAVALQKAALQANQANYDNYVEYAAVEGTGEENYVPDTQALNYRDQDISQALYIVYRLQTMFYRYVYEARELFLALKAYIRVGQFKLAQDRVNRVTIDEGKGARQKLQQLETLCNYAKSYLMEAAEELHYALQDMEKSDCNYVVLLYCLGNVYCHLKNDAKSRSNFYNGARQIANIREYATQAYIWLDVDAAVQCNLAMADYYIQIGKITNALKCLDQVASLDKIQTISYELYGLCEEKEAAYEEAVQYYESAWLLSHGSPSVAYRLAFNYMKARRHAEAVLMCQNALSEYPGFQRLKREVLYKAEAVLRSYLAAE